MRMFSFGRGFLLCLAAGLAMASLASPVLARPKKAPVVEAPPPPPPPPPAGPVGLPDRMISDAAGYEGYMLRMGATSPGFTSAETVAQALKAGSAYGPKSFIRGAIAYAAIAALKDQAFVAALRSAGNSPENRHAMVQYIALNPVYVFQFKGSDAAAGLAREALGSTALSLATTGRLIRQAAYDVQHQSWSAAQVADAPGRLAAVEAAAAADMAPAAEREPILKRAATGEQPLALDAAPLPPPYAAMVERALQIAAIAALGEATDAEYDHLRSISADLETELCLERAKRDLYQCLAVARPNYEDIFCMARHEMLQPAGCMAAGAGVELPPEPAPPPTPVKAAHKKTHHKSVRHA